MLTNLKKYNYSKRLNTVPPDTPDTCFFQIALNAGHTPKLFKQTYWTVWLKQLCYYFSSKIMCHTKEFILIQQLVSATPIQFMNFPNTWLQIKPGYGVVSGHLFYHYIACQN